MKHVNGFDNVSPTCNVALRFHSYEAVSEPKLSSLESYKVQTMKKLREQVILVGVD